jgi:hypothetical protein
MYLDDTYKGREAFSEDEMRRPIPRAVPCVRVCNMYELHIGSTEGGIGP